MHMAPSSAGVEQGIFLWEVRAMKCHLCDKPVSGEHRMIHADGKLLEFCGRDCLARYITGGISSLISTITKLGRVNQ